MKITVIITAYNLERYVQDAIVSVLKQTRKADEIIVVDDCSSDRTPEAIQSFGDQVRYLKMPSNQGGLSATFWGVKNSTGDLLFFLDGDDVWMPDKLESIIPVFAEHSEMAIVSHDYIRVDGNRNRYDNIDETQANIASIRNKYTDVKDLSDAYKDSILAKKGFWGGSAYALRKSFVDIQGFEEWRAKYENIRYTYLDLIIPTYIIINRPEVMVGYVDKKLFEYRIHSSNTSGNSLPGVNAAKKALRMGHCTTVATFGMLKEKPAFKNYAERQALFVKEYEYLTYVYDNKKAKIMQLFWTLSHKLWGGRKIIKELQRSLITVLFGPNFFLKLKSKIYTDEKRAGGAA